MEELITSGETPSRKLRRNSPPAELKRLVKISASLPHGQAFVESGFSTAKYVGTSRNTLSLIRKRLRQIGKLRKLLQENKLPRKGKRSRRLSREPGMTRNWKITSGKMQASWLL